MIEAVRSRFNTYYERNPMTYLEITLWSGVAAVAIAAMIAHRAWRRLKRDLAESLDKVDAQIGAVNRCRCRLIVANNQIESAYGTIASLAKDRIAVEKRARLHCRMIEDQRDRADAIWGHWAATQNDLDDAIKLRLRAAKEKLVRLAELLAPAGDMYERMGRMVGEIIEEASGERPKSLVVLQHHYVAMAGMYRKELDSFHADMAMDIAQAIEEYNKW